MTDIGEILEVIRENSFATVVTVTEGLPFVSHLPILVENTDPLVLIGHLAAQNPQAKVLASGCEVLVIFSGPHAYVSPRHYETSPNVPTWNYVAVHASGTSEVIESESECMALLDTMVSTYDPNLSKVLPEATDHDTYRSKLKGLTAFQIRVTKLEAKAKLSQNKAERDRLAVKSHFEESENPIERDVARLMKS